MRGRVRQPGPPWAVVRCWAFMRVTGGPVHRGDGVSGPGLAGRHEVRVHTERESCGPSWRDLRAGRSPIMHSHGQNDASGGGSAGTGMEGAPFEAAGP